VASDHVGEDDDIRNNLSRITHEPVLMDGAAGSDEYRFDVKILRVAFFAEAEVQVYDALKPKQVLGFLGMGGRGCVLHGFTLFT
jgi:hypothetical protein